MLVYIIYADIIIQLYQLQILSLPDLYSIQYYYFDCEKMNKLYRLNNKNDSLLIPKYFYYKLYYMTLILVIDK